MQVGGGVARAAGGAGVGAAVPRPGLGLREAGVHLGVGVGASGSLNRLIGEVVQSRRRPLLGTSPG